MAAKDSTRRRRAAARPRSTLPSPEPLNASLGRSSDDSAPMSALIEAIEHERNRLMTAESLLDCFLAAMESDDVGDADDRTTLALLSWRERSFTKRSTNSTR